MYSLRYKLYFNCVVGMMQQGIENNVIPSGALAKSRNLRIMITFAVKSVPRSFDSPCSLRMTTAFMVFHWYMLIKADNHNDNLCLYAVNMQHTAPIPDRNGRLALDFIVPVLLGFGAIGAIAGFELQLLILGGDGGAGRHGMGDKGAGADDAVPSHHRITA